jgi:ketosteroid isomerase-like protein
MTINEKAVADVLSAYNQALNSSDTDAVMPLYAENGVFMPPTAPRQSVWLKYAKRTTRFLPRYI